MPNRPPPRAHPNNTPGDFYVAADCCKLCGIPRKMAPNLFASDDRSCWVAWQPSTPVDLKTILAVMDRQELTCVRYRGTDPSVRLIAPEASVDPRDSQAPLPR